MQVKIINKSRNPLPDYETPSAAGMDLRAELENPVTLAPGERRLVRTGLYLEIPEGYEAQVRPRSGLALKHGVTVLNAPGTIDADYRGEVGVILINHSIQSYSIQPGERIAQLVFVQLARAELVAADSLADTERGDGGFGHTGKK